MIVSNKLKNNETIICENCAIQRDIWQEKRMNTLIISEGQEMYLKFF
jgi:hypothetical protein